MEEQQIKDPVIDSAHELANEAIKAEALKFLKEHTIMVISTVSPTNEPHAAVVYYVADENFNLYFATRRSTEKAQNIHNNKLVSIVVGTGPNITSMEGLGEVEMVTGVKAKIDLLVQITHVLNLKESYHWPLSELAGTDTEFFKITLKKLKWLHMDLDTYPAAYKKDFHYII